MEMKQLQAKLQWISLLFEVQCKEWSHITYLSRCAGAEDDLCQGWGSTLLVLLNCLLRELTLPGQIPPSFVSWYRKGNWRTLDSPGSVVTALAVSQSASHAALQSCYIEQCLVSF